MIFYKPADNEGVLVHKIDNVEYGPILDQNRNLTTEAFKSIVLANIKKNRHHE